MFPIINRGTWARVFAFRQIITRFIKAHLDQEVNILSLGAGYDTTYFWLQEELGSNGELSGASKERVVYVEIDFDEVVTKKIHTIKRE